MTEQASVCTATDCALAQPASATQQLLGDVADAGPASGLKTLAAATLIFFIIAQGPKGEGMINSLNGANNCCRSFTHIECIDLWHPTVPHCNDSGTRREPHAGKLHADEELCDGGHVGASGPLPGNIGNCGAETLVDESDTCLN